MKFERPDFSDGPAALEFFKCIAEEICPPGMGVRAAGVFVWIAPFVLLCLFHSGWWAFAVAAIACKGGWGLNTSARHLYWTEQKRTFVCEDGSHFEVLLPEDIIFAELEVERGELEWGPVDGWTVKCPNCWGPGCEERSKDLAENPHVLEPGEVEVKEFEPSWFDVGYKWTRLVSFVRALFKGEIHTCDRCKMPFEQCFLYGEGIEAHRSALEEKTGEKNPLPRVAQPYADWRVCIDCSFSLDDSLKTHEGCLCQTHLRKSMENDEMQRPLEG